MQTLTQKHSVHPLRRLPGAKHSVARATTTVPLLNNRQLPLQLDYELDDLPLSVWATRLYQHLVRVHGTDGRIMPSYLYMGEKCFRATLGAKASPDTLRRKAIHAMNELIDAGLVVKEKRRSSGAFRNDSDTNAYRLLDKSQWLEKGRENMARLRTETDALTPQRVFAKRVREMAKANLLALPPLLVKAGQLSRWGGAFTALRTSPSWFSTALPSAPTALGSAPTAPKVVPIEVHQSKEVCKVMLLKTRPRPREDTPPAAVETAAPVNTLPSRSKNTKKPDTAKAFQTPSTNGSAHAPKAAAPDSLEALIELEDPRNVDDTSIENVPGGAAAGDEKDEVYKRLLALMGKRKVGDAQVPNLPDLLEESPNHLTLGGANRRSWLNLELSAITQAHRSAVVTANADGGAWRGHFIRTLDRLIGAKAPQSGLSPTDKAASRADEERCVLAKLTLELNVLWKSLKTGVVWAVDAVDVCKGEYMPKITLLRPDDGSVTFVSPSVFETGFVRLAVTAASFHEDKRREESAK